MTDKTMTETTTASDIAAIRERLEKAGAEVERLRAMGRVGMSDLTPEQEAELEAAILGRTANSAVHAIAPIIAGWIDAERTEAFDAAIFWRLTRAPLPEGWGRSEAWAIERRGEGESAIQECSEDRARKIVHGGWPHIKVVKRTVITGPWEEVSDEENRG